MNSIYDLNDEDNLKISNQEFNFERIDNLLDLSFYCCELDGVKYYLDEYNKVVAFKKDNTINIYFNYKDKSGYNFTIDMAIIKGFVMKKYKLFNKKASIIYVKRIFDLNNQLDYEKKKGIRLLNNKKLVLNILDEEEHITNNVCIKGIREYKLRELEKIKKEILLGNIFEIGFLSNVDYYNNRCLFDFLGYYLYLDELSPNNDNEKYYILDKNVEYNSKSNKVKHPIIIKREKCIIDL
jgi:hypothetical protein